MSLDNLLTFLTAALLERQVWRRMGMHEMLGQALRALCAGVAWGKGRVGQVIQ